MQLEVPKRRRQKAKTYTASYVPAGRFAIRGRFELNFIASLFQLGKEEAGVRNPRLGGPRFRPVGLVVAVVDQMQLRRTV